MRSIVTLALTCALLVCPLLCGPSCGSGERATNEVPPARKCCAKCQARAKASPTPGRGDRREVPRRPARPTESDDDTCLLHCLCKGAVKNGAVALETTPQFDPLAATDAVSNPVSVAIPARRDGGPPGRPPDGRTLRLAITSLRC